MMCLKWTEVLHGGRQSCINFKIWPLRDPFWNVAACPALWGFLMALLLAKNCLLVHILPTDPFNARVSVGVCNPPLFTAWQTCC